MRVGTGSSSTLATPGPDAQLLVSMTESSGLPQHPPVHRADWKEQQINPKQKRNDRDKRGEPWPREQKTVSCLTNVQLILIKRKLEETHLQNSEIKGDVTANLTETNRILKDYYE